MTALAFPPPNVQFNTEPPPPPDGNSILLRQEVWGPTEELTSTSRYILRLPKAVTWDEIVFDSPTPGSLSLGIQVQVNGVNLFAASKSMNTGILHVPKAQWAVAFQSGALALDAALYLILSVSPPGGYGTDWAGLGVTLVKA